MKCKYCNNENIEESNFCPKCGKSLKQSEEKVFTKPINKNKEKTKREKIAKISALVWVVSVLAFLLTSAYGSSVMINNIYPSYVEISFIVEIAVGCVAFFIMFVYALASLAIPKIKPLQVNFDYNSENKNNDLNKMSLAEQIGNGIEDVLFIPKQRKPINGVFGIIFFIFSIFLLIFAFIALNQ